MKKKGNKKNIKFYFYLIEIDLKWYFNQCFLIININETIKIAAKHRAASKVKTKNKKTFNSI
jgi:hypothetical protein